MKILSCCQPQYICSLLFRELFYSSLCSHSFSSVPGEKCPFLGVLEIHAYDGIAHCLLAFIINEPVQQVLDPLFQHYFLMFGSTPFSDLL